MSTLNDEAEVELPASNDKIDVIITQQIGQEAYSLANDAHRGLLMRHVQLIAISGAIGAGLFVSIGGPLTHAGPLGLLIGMGFWCCVIFAAANCLVEITTLYPLDGGFIRFADRFVERSFGMAIGWNFVVSNLGVICFEMTAMNLVIEYWKPLNPAIVISVTIALLAAINLYSVKSYGEVEFWISISKVLLCLALTLYTFITMLGGNTSHDRYGFRFWKSPGPIVGTGVDAIRGIYSVIIWASFALAGPEYLSIVAGEVKNPRRIMPRAYKSTIFRILFFYMTGALCVGIVASSSDPSLLGAIAGGAPGVAKSPYVISINRLHVPVLPHIVNALIILSIFSTTNSYVFSASRAMTGLAHRGAGPKVLLKLSKRGVPWVSVTIVLLISCLAYLAVSTRTAVVLDWWISLVGSATLINWAGIGITYLRFRAGLKSQGLFHTDFRPALGYLQPVSGWWLVFWPPIVFLFNGWSLFAPGGWDVPNFFFTYGAGFIFLAIYLGSKIWEKGIRRRHTINYLKASEMDFASDLQEIEALTLASEEERARQQGEKQGIFHKVERALF